jgi:trehalose-6-phosphate synthase
MVTTGSGIFIATKRAPVEHRDTEHEGRVSTAAPWAIANVLADMATAVGAPWVASAATAAERRLAEQSPAGTEIDLPGGAKIRLHLIVHDPEVFETTDKILSSDLLWAASNYLWDTWHSPTFDDWTRRLWARYRSFSEGYAAALERVANDVHPPRFVLHDYQMTLVPGLLRAARPDASILLYLHTPWPSPDYFRLLPRYARRPMLESMLSATVVGFLAQRWVTNFTACVSDVVPEALVDESSGIVLLNGRQTSVQAIPLGYSPAVLSRHRPRLPQELAAWVGASPLAVHYGRSDPIKNAARAVQAFTLAVRDEDHLADARMLVRVNPHRLHVDANRAYLSQVETVVGDANRALGREAVRLVLDSDIAATLGCFERADVTIVNSTIDGQNLTAFESSIVSEAGGLILSETCGAAEILGEAATVVSPFDLAEQATAIRTVLCAPRQTRSVLAQARRDLAEAYTSDAWIERQLASLDAHGQRSA